MTQHLINDLLRWKRVIFVTNPNASHKVQVRGKNCFKSEGRNYLVCASRRSADKQIKQVQTRKQFLFDCMSVGLQ